MDDVESKGKRDVVHDILSFGITQPNIADLPPLTDIRSVEGGGLPLGLGERYSGLVDLPLRAQPRQRPGPVANVHDTLDRRNAVGWILTPAKERP